LASQADFYYSRKFEDEADGDWGQLFWPLLGSGEPTDTIHSREPSVNRFFFPGTVSQPVHVDLLNNQPQSAS
jgi:hypothetical protein